MQTNQLPEQATATAESFSHFLNEQHAPWATASVLEKEKLLHDYMNTECGAGVFTHQVGKTDIKVEFSKVKETIIDCSSDLKAIDQQIEDFFKTI